MIYESHLEEACLRWFADLGYEVLETDNLDPSSVYDERGSSEEVVLEGRLRGALGALNPELTDDQVEEAVRRLLRRDWPTLEQNNLEFHRALTDGLTLEVAGEGGTIRGLQVRLFDFDEPERNDWVACNQVEFVDRTSGTGQKRRPDVVVWVNGLPLAVLELKNPGAANADIWGAYNQLQTYKRDIPSLFATNELLVISDDVLTRVGSLTAPRARFQPWRAIENEQDLVPGEAEGALGEGGRLEALLRGVFHKERFLDLVRNFVAFETHEGKINKLLAAYHQFHAVRRAVDETRQALADRSRKVGVVWHTQGSGKSLTMLFYGRKLVLDPALDNPTLVVLTDRNDLDQQLFETFARSHELLRQTPIKAEDRKQLRDLLKTSAGGVYFTTIQKFLPESGERLPALSERRNIIVIADEAHRSQYGFLERVDKKTGKSSFGLAVHMRDALPNAAFIGFTGTPIELDDKNTVEVFGNYISVYDIRRAVEDKATVPIYYENRVAKLQLDEQKRPHIDADFEEVTEGEEDAVKEGLKSEWSTFEAIVGTDERIARVAEDVVAHFDRRLEAMAGGKAMLVGMSRRICVAMYDAIVRLRPAWHATDDSDGAVKVVMTGSAKDGPEYKPHVRSKERLKALAQRFKNPADGLRIVIVRDMWLTGFDAPCLHTLYVDKPMQGHSLMQAIARVNRVFADKPAGLVVDYLGIAPVLREAMHTYAASGGKGDATNDVEKAWELLLEKLEVCHNCLHGFDYQPFFKASAERRLAILAGAREHILKQRASQTQGLQGTADGHEIFLRAVAALSGAAGIVSADERFEEKREEVAFLQAIRAGLIKLSPGRARPTADLQAAVRQIVASSIVSDEVIDVFSAAGLPRPDISVLSAEFLAEVAGMEHKNLAAALLERILRDQIRIRGRDSVIQARSFEQLLDSALQRYLSRSIEVAQVIQELLELATTIAKAEERAKELGLSREELRFYEALADNKSAQDILGDGILSQIARELTIVVRKTASIDWDRKKSVQAKLRVEIKKLLKRHKYPPDAEARAIETVLEQARRLGINLVEGAPPEDDTGGPDTEEGAPRELPYPLAVFEQLVLSCDTKALRVKTMIDAVERALSFTAICTLAHLRALNGGTLGKAVLEVLGEGVGKPVAMGVWLHYAQGLAKLLPSEARDPVVQAARVFIDDSGKPSALAQVIATDVLPYRNTFSHTVTVDEAQVLQHEEPIKRAWSRLIQALAPFRRTELISSAGILRFGAADEVWYKLRVHQGGQSPFPVVERSLSAKLAERWTYLLRQGSAPLPLAPFLACEYVKEKDARELLIARAIMLAGKKVEMVGVATTTKLKLDVPTGSGA